MDKHHKELFQEDKNLKEIQTLRKMGQRTHIGNIDFPLTFKRV